MLYTLQSGTLTSPDNNVSCITMQVLSKTSMSSLWWVWSQGRLSLVSKLQIYNTCIVPVLLYGSENWTILTADLSEL